MTASDFFIAEQRVRLQKLTKSKDKIDTLKIFNIKDPGVLFDYANYLQSKRKYKKVSNIIFNLSSLPITNPGVEGQLWRDGTDLKISLG